MRRDIHSGGLIVQPLFWFSAHENGPTPVTPELDMVYSHYPRIKERHHAIVGHTSGGEQQMTALGYILENGRVVMDGEAGTLTDNENVQGILPRCQRRRADELSRHQALSPTQALAGVEEEVPTW